MDAVRQTFAVVLVFAALGLALWVLRRAGGVVSWRRTLRFGRAVGSPRTLETVERISLTPQHALHVVRWHGCELIVATSPQGCTLLTGSVTESSSARGADA